MSMELQKIEKTAKDLSGLINLADNTFKPVMYTGPYRRYRITDSGNGTGL